MSLRFAAAVALAVITSACGASPPIERSKVETPDTWVGANETFKPRQTPASTPDEGERGKDFIAEAKLLFRVVACAGDADFPDGVDPRIVEAHCAQLLPKLAAYRTTYVRVAKPFLSALAPANAPRSVVYPFAGGDLVTAITTYPDAREYTTLSLELTGDPRRARTLGRNRLESSLEKLREELDELTFVDDYSKSETLKRTQRGDIPDELAFFLVGLAVHDFEPTSLRYFDVKDDGSLHYLSSAEIDDASDRLAQQKKGTWWPPDFSEAFANVEIGFRPKGAKPGEGERIHRHLAVNLSDESLRGNAGVLKHLEAKGDVLAMTKAASYLLWNDGFSSIRDYLLAHATFMVSDSTGIPPAFAERAGFVFETYGGFKASLLHAPERHNVAFKKIWDSQPKRKLPFRYGYHDKSGQSHLVVMKRPAVASAKQAQVP